MSIKDFKPRIVMKNEGTWTATLELPVVGKVTTYASHWQEAKLRLWLLSEAVKIMEKQPKNDPKDWTDEEWKTTLKLMREVMK